MDPPDDVRGCRAAAASLPVAPSTSYSLSAKAEGLEPNQTARQTAAVKTEPDSQRNTWQRRPASVGAQRDTSSSPATGRGQAVNEAAASLTLLPAPGSRVGSRFPEAGGADARATLTLQPASTGAPHPDVYPVRSTDRRAAAGVPSYYSAQQLQQQQQQQPPQQPVSGLLWGLPLSAPVMHALQSEAHARSQAGWAWGADDAAVPAASQLPPWAAAAGAFSASSAAPRVHPDTSLLPSAPHLVPMAVAPGDGADPLRPTVLIGGAGRGAAGDSPRGGSPPPEVMMQHAAALLSLADFLPDGDDAPAQVL